MQCGQFGRTTCVALELLLKGPVSRRPDWSAWSPLLHLCKRGWAAEPAAQAWAVNGLGLGGHGAAWRGLPGPGTPSNAVLGYLVANLCPSHQCASLHTQTFMCHFCLLHPSLGGSSGVELARPPCNGARAAARRWAAGQPRPGSARQTLQNHTNVWFYLTKCCNR